MIHLGFTGTQKGMTYQQKAGAEAVLLRWMDNDTVIVHHGGCVGADLEFHIMAMRWENSVEVHPQNTNEKKRADITASGRVIIHPAKAPLARNLDIVDASDILIATPRQSKEVRRSGTWTTIRYARAVPMHVIIIDPEGFEFS